MRVLVVSHTYISKINRKKWQVFASLYPDIQIKVLFPSEWKTTLFNHKVESDFSSFDLSNCKFISMDTFKSGNEVLYGYNFKKLSTLIKTFKPAMIHVEQGDNAFSYLQCILFSKLLRLKSKNVFFTWVNWREKFSLKYKLFWSCVEKFNLKYSSGAFVGNADAGQILQEKEFGGKICVLPQLGVDTDIFKPAKKKTVNIKKIGFIGRLIDEKGIFTLLDAFENISAMHPDWQLIYLGNGSFQDMLQSQIDTKKLHAQVFIQKTVSHDQVANFIQDLDIFVLPSFDISGWREQFGHVLIEAMACKVPIIGSDAGEIPNVIADVGLIFEQKNVQSLQHALQSLMLDKTLREELGEKGYQKVIEQYSHQAIAAKTYEFWMDVIEGD